MIKKNNLTHADYAKINIACKDLCLDLHQLIGDRYGLESSKMLTRWQLEDLYSHFRSLGWKVKRKKDNDFGKTYPDPHMRKVQALWITLGKAGVIRNRGDKAMNKYVKRMTKKENLRWCDGADCDLLIEGLKAIGKRNDIDFD